MDFQIKKFSSSGKGGMKKISEQIQPSLHSLFCMKGKTVCLCPQANSLQTLLLSSRGGPMWCAHLQLSQCLHWVCPALMRAGIISHPTSALQGDQGVRGQVGPVSNLCPFCLSSCCDTEPCSHQAHNASTHSPTECHGQLCSLGPNKTAQLSSITLYSLWALASFPFLIICNQVQSDKVTLELPLPG